mmetsp:Transcript_6781/g.21009  ORF Transcript_6781/g.21009 Transcript_6781/m.21009 type:complete len:136 (-) Transcript_6781:653-1060(-)
MGKKVPSPAGGQIGSSHSQGRGPSTAARFPASPWSYDVGFAGAFPGSLPAREGAAELFSQNSIVVIAMNMSQTWKHQNDVTSTDMNSAKVSPKKRKNIGRKSILWVTDRTTDSIIVQKMNWHASQEYNNRRKNHL